jgi:Icc-related predicted phosphoesterase
MTVKEVVAMGKGLRILFTTDLHASEKCYLKFLKTAGFYKADVLILGGDITGKMIIPIVEQEDGGFVANLHGNSLRVERGGVAQLEHDIQNAGYYPYRTIGKEAEALQDDKKRVEELFTQLMVEMVGRWVALAEEKLKSTTTKVYISPGNDDHWEIDPVLSGSEFVINPEERVVDIGGYEMITLGYTNPTPWNTSREISEEELAQKIEKLASQVGKMKTSIFNLHCPPIDTPLDVAMKLDSEWRPVMKGGEPEMIHVGSKSVRAAIVNHQPLIGLHGHIHEARSTCKIGQTLCVNPGSEYGEGILRGALVELEGGRVKYCLLTSG